MFADYMRGLIHAGQGFDGPPAKGFNPRLPGRQGASGGGLIQTGLFGKANGLLLLRWREIYLGSGASLLTIDLELVGGGRWVLLRLR